jgi:tRNA pseudouridine38-40 synthase
MQTRNIRLDIAYNGTRFHGWQLQKDNLTVQGEIQRNLSVILNQPCVLFGASRTDAGVHARGQAAHFFTESSKEIEIIHQGLNKRLPVDIDIINAREVPPTFHARKSALGKHYQYRIWLSKEKPVFDSQFVYWFREDQVDLAAMNAAAKQIEGVHDFSSFASNAHRKDENKIRRVDKISMEKSDSLLVIDVFGQSFLYKMVRGICGTLLEIGRGKPLDIPSIFEAKIRGSAARNLPGQGLTLMKVFY